MTMCWHETITIGHLTLTLFWCVLPPMAAALPAFSISGVAEISDPG